MEQSFDACAFLELDKGDLDFFKKAGIKARRKMRCTHEELSKMWKCFFDLSNSSYANWQKIYAAPLPRAEGENFLETYDAREKEIADFYATHQRAEEYCQKIYAIREEISRRSYRFY